MIDITGIAEKLSAEATRLTAELGVTEARQTAIAIAALLMASCVEGHIHGVSVETMLAGFRKTWRDVEKASDTLPQLARKVSDDSN